MSRLLAASVSFEQGVVEKVSFILLSYLDFTLTLLALRLGFSELNPFIQRTLAYPGAFFSVKILASILIAWLVPGKLLLPALAFMLFVVGWDASQLVFHLL